MVHNIFSIVKGTTTCKIIFSMYKRSYLQNSEPGLFNVTGREKTEAAKYHLST
jgi:hypothetical protein